jgi:hypothetical protein
MTLEPPRGHRKDRERHKKARCSVEGKCARWREQRGRGEQTERYTESPFNCQWSIDAVERGKSLNIQGFINVSHIFLCSATCVTADMYIRAYVRVK